MIDKIITVAILFCLNIIQITAQDASIRGIITGGDDHAGLVGVNILLKGSVQGTIPGLHGDYILGEIPAGSQTLIFSYIGYETIEISLDFRPGEEKEYHLELVPGSIDLSAVSLEARQPFSAASSKAIRDYDLKIKPVRSAQDLLYLVPGLYIAQHAGGGKAEQIFMRGFDADHGTDVGITVDGLPVNMVTHGHGQGYADLHFVIPEIIEGMTVFKGPYFGQYGNFGTAGSVSFTKTDHPDHNLVKLEGVCSILPGPPRYLKFQQQENIRVHISRDNFTIPTDLSEVPRDSTGPISMENSTRILPLEVNSALGWALSPLPGMHPDRSPSGPLKMD